MVGRVYGRAWLGTAQQKDYCWISKRLPTSGYSEKDIYFSTWTEIIILQNSCKSSSVTPPLQLDKTSQAQRGPMPSLSPQQGSNPPGQ